MSDSLDLERAATALARTMNSYGETVLRRRNTSYTQFRILSILTETPGIPGKRVAHCLGVSGAAASKQLKILTRGELVASRTQRGEGRAQRLELTHAGRELFTALASELHTPLVECCRIAGEDFSELSAIFRALNDIVSTRLSEKVTGRTAESPIPAPRTTPNLGHELSAFLAALNHRTEAQLSMHGVTLPQFAILRLVCASPGLNGREIAEELDYSTPTVSGHLAHLRALGLAMDVSREGSGNTQQLESTAAGRGFTQEVLESTAAWVHEVCSQAGVDEAALATRLLAVGAAAAEYPLPEASAAGSR
ncbi:MarR family transcriptional regulator [Leucobacter sp. CSA2]|uniref:MarR family transcriptional regulator n=1 Tax=Leucobacter edaphi TaxID=2796472 RepID=A0A934UY19_9MICO|nr:MarR family transcriptional regulator [Leucobacter edaphi]MBK0421953.1 MarR family transcriptional regulator [Leucobacter edaphi]